MLRKILLIALLAISLPSLAQDKEAAPPAAIISWLKLGSHINPDLSVPVPKKNFKPTEDIYAVVGTKASKPTYGTLGILWTYGSGDHLQAVHDESKELVFDGDGITAFKISKPDGWPSGTYQAELFIDGHSASKISFIVR